MHGRVIQAESTFQRLGAFIMQPASTKKNLKQRGTAKHRLHKCRLIPEVMFAKNPVLGFRCGIWKSYVVDVNYDARL